MSTRDKDRGWNRIMRNMETMDNAFTKVGLPLGATVKHEVSNVNKIFFGKKVEIEDKNVSISELIEYAAANEFGTKNIPERSFLRSAFDQNRFKMAKIQDTMVSRLLKGRTTVKKGIALIGEVGVRLVNDQITNLRSPSNDPKTIKRKGSSNPLIDTGRMRASITHAEGFRGI